MEDGPVLELNLGEHLALDLTIDLTSTLLDVETIGSTTCVWAHQQVASSVLKTLELLRILVELEMPKRLLLFTLLVSLEVMHEILDLLDLGFSICMHNLCQVLHESEISAHGVSQTCNLAELGDEGNLNSSATIFVDQKWLVWILDLLVISGLIVLLVAGLSTLFVECRQWGLCEINPINLVGLLVVGCYHSRTTETTLNRVISILISLFRIRLHVVHQFEHRVSANYLETDVNVEKTALFLHDESGVKARPYLDVVGIQAVSRRLIERFLSNGLKAETPHHRVEENLEEIHVVSVVLLHDLDPLDGDLVLDSVILGFVDR